MNYATRKELAQYISDRHLDYLDTDHLPADLIAKWIDEYFKGQIDIAGRRLEYAADYLANNLYQSLSDLRPQTFIPVVDEKLERVGLAFHLKDEYWTISDELFAKEYLEPCFGAIARTVREVAEGSYISFNACPELPHGGTGTIGCIAKSNPLGVAVRGLEGYDGMAQAGVFSFSVFIKKRAR